MRPPYRDTRIFHLTLQQVDAAKPVKSPIARRDALIPNETPRYFLQTISFEERKSVPAVACLSDQQPQHGLL